MRLVLLHVCACIEGRCHVIASALVQVFSIVIVLQKHQFRQMSSVGTDFCTGCFVSAAHSKTKK